MMQPTYSETFRIRAGPKSIEGALWLPPDPVGVVLLACEDEHNDVKPSCDYLTGKLRSGCLGTFRLDLPSPDERSDMAADEDSASRILSMAFHWLTRDSVARNLPVGLFGAGDGAAAIWQLASERDHAIASVVTCGGRPDASILPTISKIGASTLLIAGGLDEDAVALNRAAYTALRCEKKLEIIPGATRTFDEPGIPEVLSRLARAWFLRHAAVSV